jgi:hypothetical protein
LEQGENIESTTGTGVPSPSQVMLT